MSDLFRLMVLRPPEDVNPSATIAIDHESAFLSSLRDASKSQAPLVTMQQVAEDFARSELFVSDASALNYFEQYQAVSDAIAAPHKLTISELTALIEKLFHANAKHLVGDKKLSSDEKNVQDSLVALQLASPPPKTQPEQLLRLCRAIDLIERVIKGDPSLTRKGAIAQAVNRIVVLPADLFPIAAGATQPAALALQDPAQQPNGSATVQKQLVDRASAIHQTLQEMSTVAAETVPSVSSLPAGRAAATTRAGSMPNVGLAFSTMARKPAVASASDGGSARLHGIDVATLQALSPTARQVVNALGVDVAAIAPSVLMDRLNAELTFTLNLMTGLSPSDKLSTVPIPLPQPDPFHEPPPPPEWAFGSPSPFPFPPSTPNPLVKPAGIADLLVVREHALRYEPVEIAFVENIARGETFKRHTNRKTTTENSTLTTTVSSSETERDLQTTDRFGLQRQSQSTIQDLADSVAGMGMSSAYGPLVDSSGSLAQSASRVSSYGQDVTRRAVNKLSQSVETQVFQRSTAEFAERVEHEFNNTAKATDQIVVYQWLEKIVQAKVFTYGKRVLYDVVVPEPAAFLVYEMQKWQPELAALRKPTLFSRQARWLSDDPKNADYYQYWASGYGASGSSHRPNRRS